MSKALRHLWIERKLYLIPRSSKDILMLITQVFLGIESVDGLITFDGKKYKLDNIDIFERFLIFWLMAQNNGESDPIMTEAEIPVELAISQDKVVLKAPKTYSHEKKE